MASLGMLMVMASVQVLLCGLALWAVRAIFKDRLAARWRVAAWLVLAVRLLVPVNLAPAAAPIQLPVAQAALTQPMWQEPTQTPAAQQDDAQTPGAPQGGQPTGGKGTYKSAPTLPQLAFWGWAAGVVAIVGWQATVRLRFARALRNKRREDNPQLTAQVASMTQRLKLRRVPVVYRTNAVPGPLVAGLLRPTILLPEWAKGAALEPILWHELCHVKRGDLWVKQLVNLAAVLHWPNPFVHIMRRLAGQDIELACDELALQTLGHAGRAAYADAVLQSVRRTRLLPGSVSAFSSGGRLVRRRLRAMFHKPARRASAALMPTVLALVLLAGCTVGPATSQAVNAQPPAQSSGFDVPQPDDEIFTPLQYDAATFTECPITGLMMAPDGTRLVSSTLDLLRVGRARDSLALTYLQTADIRVSGWDITIGEDEDAPFTGSYDGNGYAIIGFDASEGQSMFPYAQDAVIQRVTLRDAILPEGALEGPAIVGSASGCVVKSNGYTTGVLAGSLDVVLTGMPLLFYEGDHPYISYQFTNHSDEAMYGGVVYMLAYDKTGQPLELAWYDAVGGSDKAYLNASNLGTFGEPLQPGQSYDITGGWSLTDRWRGGEDTDVCYIVATFASIELESGTWQNPDIEAWTQKWVGNPAAIEDLEGYYPLSFIAESTPL